MGSVEGHRREVVATVAGRPITVGDVDDRETAVRRGPAADRLPAAGTPEGVRLRRWLVQLLVTEHVVLHEAAAAGVAPGHRQPGRELDGARPVEAPSVLHAARRLFERVTAGVRVAEAEVRAYYDRNPDLYRRPESRRVRHVLVADASTAAKVAERVAGGEDMAELARRWSIDRGTRGRGGDMGRVSRGELVGPFEDAVFAAAPGAVVGPVATEFGWHVARVEEATAASSVPYGDARASIVTELAAAARGRAFDGWLDERRAALVEIARDWVHPGDPSLPDAVHRH